MHINHLETPSLILDKNKLAQNINNFNQHMKDFNIKTRPHGKTAKNIEILKMCITSQSSGITVSTLKEAEYYFEHGINDIIYAVGIASVKLDRVIRLLKKGCQLALILDSIEQAKTVNEHMCRGNFKIPVYIEINSDGKRAGVNPDDSLLVAVGKELYKNEGTELKGVLTHAGASYQAFTRNNMIAVADMERDNTVKCAETLRENGIPCSEVSIGSTPTAVFGRDFSGITEIRAGVYMFMDLVMAGLGVCRLDDIAISVLTSIIGHQKEKSKVITDSGWMSLSGDRGTASHKTDQGFGLVCDLEGNPLGDYIVSATSQEHGIISHRYKKNIDWDLFPIGGMVRILPNHSCAMAAMFDSYQVVEGSTEVVNIWPRINGW
jgi:D-serine deaminase-like pyridoxal phosphate-dependent protein